MPNKSMVHRIVKFNDTVSVYLRSTTVVLWSLVMTWWKPPSKSLKELSD